MRDLAMDRAHLAVAKRALENLGECYVVKSALIDTASHWMDQYEMVHDALKIRFEQFKTTNEQLLKATIERDKLQQENERLKQQLKRLEEIYDDIDVTRGL